MTPHSPGDRTPTIIGGGDTIYGDAKTGNISIAGGGVLTLTGNGSLIDAGTGFADTIDGGAGTADTAAAGPGTCTNVETTTACEL